MQLNVTYQLIKLLTVMIFLSGTASAQHEEKPRPEAWNNLIYGGRFMDRILPAPIYDKLTSDTWGADAVRPRDIHNGIEDPDWSYWAAGRF